MPKAYFHGERARLLLRLGFFSVTRMVSVTLGPKGRCVVIGGSLCAPRIVCDGVTVARSIRVRSRCLLVGANLIRQIALRTNRQVGDGTTTAVVIAHALLKESTRKLCAGTCRLSLASEVSRRVRWYVESLMDSSRPIEDDYDLGAVARVSAGADARVGSLVKDAFLVGGREAIISVEENTGKGDHLQLTEGFSLESSCHPFFFDPGAEELILERPFIFVSPKKVESFKEQLLPTIELIKKEASTCSILVVSEGVSKVVLRSLLLNNSFGRVRTVFLRAPGFGKRREEFLRDLVTVIRPPSAQPGLRPLSALAHQENAGRAERAVLRRDRCLITFFEASRSRSRALCEFLRREYETNKGISLYEKNILRERIKALKGSFVSVRVGGATETEVRDRVLRAEDALNATRCAIEGGLVPGGGVAMYRLGHLFPSDDANDFFSAFDFSGVLSRPLKKIISNSGQSGSTISCRLRSMPYSFGYDVVAKEYCCMFDRGIVDPVKVSCSALLNAANLVAEYLRTDSLLV